MININLTDTEVVRDNITKVSNVLRQDKVVLDKLTRELEWEPVYNILKSQSGEFVSYRGIDFGLLVRSTVLREFAEMFNVNFKDEVSDRMSYQSFLDLKYGDVLPEDQMLDDYREFLENTGLFYKLFSMLCNEIAMKKIIPDIDITNISDDTLTEHSGELEDSDIEGMISEIEKRVQNLYKDSDSSKDQHDSQNLPASGRELDEKLNEIDSTLKNLSENLQHLKQTGVDSTDSIIGDSISEKLKGVDDKVKESGKTNTDEAKHSDELYKKLFDSFYSQLKEQNLLKEDLSKDEVMHRVSPSSGQIDELQTQTTEQPRPEHPKLDDDFVLEKGTDKTTGRDRPVVMIPRRSEINLSNKKKFQIFNDSNLTEDYELGLRFYKLGYKTSFVNLKTDSRHGNSRIATGEYFPNTFWGSVKQKSRWIAGIVFQGAKIYGWKGSLKTKYFLLRDRKAPLAMVGTFLAYIVLIYFIVYFVSAALGNPLLPRIIPRNSPLNYLVIGTLFFMCIRVFQRFAFTYNWYGLRYAIFSIPRMLIDNVVNLFATLRAFKVFRQTKDKVVWDSTEHY